MKDDRFRHDPALFSFYRTTPRDLVGNAQEQPDAPVGKWEAAVWIAVCSLLSVLAYAGLAA